MRIPRSSLRIALLTALTAGLCGCDGGPDSAPGTLTATVVSPNGNEGAAVVSIWGPGIERVSAVEGEVFSLPGAGDTVRVVVVNPSGGFLRFGVAVTDTTRVFGGAVHEVAGPDDALRTVLSGYVVEFLR